MPTLGVDSEKRQIWQSSTPNPVCRGLINLSTEGDAAERAEDSVGMSNSKDTEVVRRWVCRVTRLRDHPTPVGLLHNSGSSIVVWRPFPTP